MEDNYKYEKMVKSLLKSLKPQLNNSNSTKHSEDLVLLYKLQSILALTLVSSNKQEFESCLDVLKEIHTMLNDSIIWLSAISCIMSFFELEGEDQKNIWEGKYYHGKFKI